jgi:hypothetical protein
MTFQETLGVEGYIVTAIGNYIISINSRIIIIAAPTEM